MDVVVERSYNLVDLLSATQDIVDINREIEEYLAKFENEISEPIPEFEKGKIENYRPLQNITWAITGLFYGYGLSPMLWLFSTCHLRHSPRDMPTNGDVGRNLWICDIHGSACAIYGFIVCAEIHGYLRNLWILGRRQIISDDFIIVIPRWRRHIFTFMN